MIGLDLVVVKCCGLLYDIGKVVDYEFEGGYFKIGVDLFKCYGELVEVVYVVFGYYDEIIFEYFYIVLVVIVDVCSVLRLGVCCELLERYVKWMEELELIVCEFKGVV